MASASLLKSSLVLNKSEWVKGPSFRQPSVSHVRCQPVPFTVKAVSSYSEELIKTAVRRTSKLYN